MVDAVVGEAQVQVNADLTKLLAGLDKAKANTQQFTTQASRSFLTVENAIQAASVGLVAYSAKAAGVTVTMASMAAGVATVSVGLKNMLGLLAQVGVATARLAERNPRLAVAGAGFLLGNPVLGVAAALTGTRAGGALAGAAGFALRRPGAALGIGAAGGVLGIAAVGAAAAAGSAGFNALKDSFNKAREASRALQIDLAALKDSATSLSANLGGGEQRDVALRRMGGAAGGLTSAFAQLAGGGGEVSSAVIERSDEALKELTLRFGDAQKAANVLAEALKNPAKAMTLLREAGIFFTADQRRQLEGTETLVDRLRNASKVLDIISGQLPSIKRGGFIEFMAALGRFAAQAPGTFGQYIVDILKGIGNELLRISGLTRVFNAIDEGFRKIGTGLQSLNRRLFPETVAQELDALKFKLDGINDAIARIDRGTAGLGGIGGVVDAISGGALSGQARATLERNRYQVELQQQVVREREEARQLEEYYAQERGLDNRIQERLQGLREELSLLQARNQAQLEANRVAAVVGLPRTDPRVQEAARLNQAIENRRRAISQAGQLSVFERENTQLQQQVQLFRYGNIEMEERTRLLQIELSAAQRRQPLTDAQRQALLNQIITLREVQRLTTTVNEATSTLFNAMGDSLAQFATTGKFKFKEFADSVIQQLVRIALQSFVIRPLLNAISGITNPLIAGGLSAGSTTSAISVPTLGGHAEGGSFKVPGSGSGDQPFLIGLTPGERVDVTPSGGKGRGAGGGVTVINTVNSSKDMDVQSTRREGPDGQVIIEQVFSEVMKKIGQGDGDGTFGARFGMRPRTVQR